MNETTDATAVFAPLWKRKWLILAVAIVVAAGSYVYYKHQPSVYSATTQIYLGNGAEEQAQLNSSAGGKKASGPNATTQAALINSSVIKEAVRAKLRRAPKTRSVRAALKGKATAKASEKSEFITINGEAHNAHGAALLVNTTAQTYVKRQNARYRREVEDAIALARKQLRRVEAGQLESLIASASPSNAGKTSTSTKSTSGSATIQAATLSAKINQLESDLEISQVTQVDPAKPRAAQLVSPHPRQNAIFGFAVGLLLAAFAAYAVDRLDRRLRSVNGIEETFQMPVLAALQAVRHPLVIRDGHPTPAYALREALWRLQTTLRVGSAAENGEGRGPRTVLCVSADARDGKSTLVAALALAWGESGERVAVVEADFRRPVQGRLLNLSASPGLADVLTGMLPLEEATQSVSLLRPEAGVGAGSSPLPTGAGGATATVVESAGSVSVLVGGTGVANPPALLGRASAIELIKSLGDEFDHVLIDAPSPLQVSDAVPLLGAVDGVLIVARSGHTRVTTAQRLVQLLQRTPCAPVLGVVANAVPPREIKRYGIQANLAQDGHGLRHNLIGR